MAKAATIPVITAADVTVPRGEKAQARTTTVYRIAELIGRYRVEHDTKAGTFHLFDVEGGSRLPAVYSDEATAHAGKRLAAACDIRALFDSPVKR